MVIKKVKESLSLSNKNLLPLLAVTALILSVCLANYSHAYNLNSTNSQSVLSEFDDKDEDLEEEQETEDEDEDVDKDKTEGNEEKKESSEVEFEQESETVLSDGQTVKFKLKSKTKIENGKTVVETESGKVEVKNSPNNTVNALIEGGEIDTPVSIEVKTNRKNVEFELQGTDTKQFLGIFKVVIPKTLTVSSETGEVISTSQNFWSRVLSLLSR